MENQNVFRYRYSAEQNREVEQIRKKYMPREVTDLERLQELDRRAQSAGVLQGLSVGIIGCLIFGIGICFGLDVFSGPYYAAALLVTLGIALMIPAYPIYRRISRKTKEQLTPEILRLTDELMKE